MQGQDRTTRQEALLNMQQQYLEALRSREREVLQFIVLLATALGGFAWLIKALFYGRPELFYERPEPFPEKIYFFAFGALSILLLLLLGAMYTLALSYNYRSILLQLRKIEMALGVNMDILCAWSYAKCEFSNPEILKHFYHAYLVGSLLVFTLSEYIFYICKYYLHLYFLGIVFALALSYIYGFLPIRYDMKIKELCQKEGSHFYNREIPSCKQATNKVNFLR